MNIIFVESPTKAKTLARFLGKGYKIEATFGHLRDLPKGELGVDVEKQYLPKYVIPRDKSKRVKELRKLVKKNDRVILATDPDREGEAIAYHMAVILSQSGARITSEVIDPSQFDRITFHEITEHAINQAIQNPGRINIPLVNSQQARRILDRLVGYKLSPLLWKKLSRSWLSAGRVQSVCVRMVVEREREKEKFKKEEYWVISSQFEVGSSQNCLVAKLVAKDEVKYETNETIKLFDGDYTFSKTSINSKTSADQIIADFQSPFIVSAVDKKETRRQPAPPYTTSSMQIDAGRKLGITSKRVMQLAQKLYEEGLITYHRTDSVSLSTKFLDTAKEYIEKEYGKQYAKYRTYTTKSKSAQEAHEAIRPTKVEVRSIDGDWAKLYELIWKRAIASQMSEAIFDSTTIRVRSNNNYLFETQGSIIKSVGFLKVVGIENDANVLPQVSVGDIVLLKKSIPEQKYTSPPPRYNEASLIKSLEEAGVGRPSTYAPTISTIQERQYVAKETKEDGRIGRSFVPTELGFLVNDFLVSHFSEIVDLPFTAKMEGLLDEIAEGVREWVPVISEFYVPFEKALKLVEETVVKKEVPIEKTGEKCPDCKIGELIIKQGRFGKFIACSRFPECKFTQNSVDKIGVKCPDCQIGEIVVKKTKRGRIFYGCLRYPDCKFASWTKPSIGQEVDKKAEEKN